MIRSLNDAILGVIMFVLGSYVALSGRVVGKITGMSQGGFLARADVYVKGLGGILGILGVILIIKSINFSKKEKQASGIIFTKEVILSMIALVIYAIILPIIGFVFSSILMVAFITYIYRMKEDENIEEGEKNKSKIAVISIRYAVVLVLILYFVFTYLLKVTLP